VILARAISHGFLTGRPTLAPRRVQETRSGQVPRARWRPLSRELSPTCPRVVRRSEPGVSVEALGVAAWLSARSGACSGSPTRSDPAVGYLLAHAAAGTHDPGTAGHRHAPSGDHTGHAAAVCGRCFLPRRHDTLRRHLSQRRLDQRGQQ
jgi:hypothetical protein